MPKSLDWTQLEGALLRILEGGPQVAPDLQERLGISQPSLSRLIKRLPRRVVAFGRARLRRYGVRRPLGSLTTPLPGYEVRPDGSIVEAFVIDAIAPSGFVVEWTKGPAHIYEDLPWFLQELRPAGFLGRLVPRSLPVDWLPDDIRRWTAVHVIEYAVRYGWNLPGAFLLGETVVQRRGDYLVDPPDRVDADRRAEMYAERAAAALQAGDAGSAAAGEQPKFLATVAENGQLTPVIVKFSPPCDHPANQRIADLLVAEHLALETLREAGHNAARSRIFEAANRVFLEVERFDRTPEGGRRSIATLQYVDAAFVSETFRGANGRGPSAASTGRLHAQSLIDAATHREARFREQFGEWIANPDQPFDNLAFELDGLDLERLTPAYDVNPAAYAPVRGEIPTIEPATRIALPSNADVAAEAHAAAMTFWQAVEADPRISAHFRRLADPRIARLARIKPPA